MMSMNYNAHDAVKSLIEKGATEELAEAIVKVSQDYSNVHNLVTKDDLRFNIEMLRKDLMLCISDSEKELIKKFHSALFYQTLGIIIGIVAIIITIKY